MTLVKRCTESDGCGLDEPSALCVDCHCALPPISSEKVLRKWTGVSVEIMDGHVEVWVHDGNEKRLMIRDFYSDGGIVSHWANLLFWESKPTRGRWDD